MATRGDRSITIDHTLTQQGDEMVIELGNHKGSQ